MNWFNVLNNVNTLGLNSEKVSLKDCNDLETVYALHHTLVHQKKLLNYVEFVGKIIEAEKEKLVARLVVEMLAESFEFKI